MFIFYILSRLVRTPDIVVRRKIQILLIDPRKIYNVNIHIYYSIMFTSKGTMLSTVYIVQTGKNNNLKNRCKKCNILNIYL